MHIKVSTSQAIQEIKIRSSEDTLSRIVTQSGFVALPCNGECGYELLVSFDDGTALQYEGYAEGGYRPRLRIDNDSIVVEDYF